jgi:hypothetical protein
MNRQEVFDTVVRHLFKQGKRAYRKSTQTSPVGCMYRADDGLKCAVGCLIPDDVYTPDMEWKTAGQLISEHADVLPSWMQLRPIATLLSELQSVHDLRYNWTHASHMTSALAEVAKNHLLSDAVLAEVSTENFPKE